MDTLPSFRRLPWLPGTFLVTLAAMIVVIVLSINTLHTVLAVGALIALALGSGLYVYKRTLKQRWRTVPIQSALTPRPGSPYAPTETLPAFPQPIQPPRWPRLQALMRAAPFAGVGLAFCFNYRIASDLLSARPATTLREVIAVTLFALGFALGLAARPYALRPDRQAWIAWAALVVIVTEWLTLFMLFTATFNNTYRSAIAPAVLALGAVIPLISTARELTERRYSAQLAELTLSGPGAKPSRFRALWRSGAGRLVIGALGLMGLAAYMLLAAPQLNGPSLVARVWPIALTILCVLIPRGKVEDLEAAQTGSFTR